ncbi:MAG: Ppx/GppA phosphatase family protein [Sutterella wadsworthensis]|mgnify:FL=1|jgi:exopolyphosphatase|nr:Ppx/GppA phosphatase family protein [Sutterella wadsworthensis]
MEQELLLAAVDLGSNSFRVEIGRIVNGRIVTQNYWKETIRLAAGFDETGALTDEVQERAFACLARFKERIAGLPPERVRAVGTQAFREATNSEEFLRHAEEALGYRIDILTGHEEARLVFKGCVNSLPPATGRRLVVDIGGASTEFVIGENLEAKQFESFHVGCVNTSLRFFKDGRISEERLQKAVVACSAEFEEVAESFGEGHYDEAYGSAGTFGAVADLCRQLWGTEIVTWDKLQAIKQQLLKFKNVEHISFPGLKPDRKEVIAGGLAVLIAVFSTLKIKSMRVAPGALRVGLLYDLWGRVENRDTRCLSVDALSLSTRVSQEQAALVTQITVDIAKMLIPNISVESLNLLRWAAKLHEVGTLISTSKYHRHSEYIVTHADLPGFSHAEQLLVASYVLGQRGGLSKLGNRLLNPQYCISLLALRLAVIFSHARARIALPKMKAKTSLKGISLKIDKMWLEAHPLTNYLLEEEVTHWAKTDFQLTIERK